MPGFTISCFEHCELRMKTAVMAARLCRWSLRRLRWWQVWNWPQGLRWMRRFERDRQEYNAARQDWIDLMRSLMGMTIHEPPSFEEALGEASSP